MKVIFLLLNNLSKSYEINLIIIYQIFHLTIPKITGKNKPNCQEGNLVLGIKLISRIVQKYKPVTREFTDAKI